MVGSVAEDEEETDLEKKYSFMFSTLNQNMIIHFFLGKSLCSRWDYQTSRNWPQTAAYKRVGIILGEVKRKKSKVVVSFFL